MGFFPLVGPIIKAEVGEQLVITFKNKAKRQYSITAHGVKASGAHVPVDPGEENYAIAEILKQKNIRSNAVDSCFFGCLLRQNTRADMGCSIELWSRPIRS